MNRFFKFAFVTFIFLIFPLTANASCNIVIDGSELVCTDASGNITTPFLYNDATYVPLRAVAQAFGTAVSWDAQTQTVYIGTVGGTPVLNEHINIFVDGKEFVCRDANGSVVYPILQNGTNYLPLRAISQLFGKEIVWDNVTKTAVLLTPPAADERFYLKDTVGNTSSISGLNVLVNVDADISHNGNLISSYSKSATEAYSPYGFSLSSFLPVDYEKSISYLGNGKYFIAVPSDTFASDSNLLRILAKNNTSCVYSPLYITLSVQGGYISQMSVRFYDTLKYNSLSFDESYTISAFFRYPEGFTFPNIPYPEAPHGSDETLISAQDGENSDSTMLSTVIKNYMSALKDSKAQSVINLMHTDDYNSLFSSKSKSQYAVDLNKISSQLATLSSLFSDSYTVTSLVYVDSSAFAHAEKAAKAVIVPSSSDATNSDETQICLLFKKIDGSWYITSDAVNKLLN